MPRPHLEEDAEDELEEWGADEPIGIRDELARVEASERALASEMGKGVRVDTTPLPSEKTSRHEPSSAYRTVDPESLAEKRLEEAHERLVNLQVDRAIQLASDERVREARRERFRWAIPLLFCLLLAAGVGLLAPGLLLVSALLSSLGLLLYWLVGRIEPRRGDAPPPRFPGSGG